MTVPLHKRNHKNNPKNLTFIYIKVHLYTYVTSLVTRQILSDKYNSMISLGEGVHCLPLTKA